MLANDWMPRGILMVGIVHSHANGVNIPSCVDVDYGIRILQALDTVDEFYLPIVTVIDGVFKLTCFVITKHDDRKYVCREVGIIVVD